MTEDRSPRSVVVGTEFCYPVRSLDDLRHSVINSLSRALLGDSLEHRTVSVAYAAENYLNQCAIDACPWRTPCDEEGRFVVFLQLAPPISLSKSRHGAVQESYPQLVSMLFPDIAFNLSDVEAVYEFSLSANLDIKNLVVHKDSPYISYRVAFAVLAREHPALFIALAHGVLPHSNPQVIATRDVLKSTHEHLGRIKTSIVGAIEEHSVQHDTMGQVLEMIKRILDGTKTELEATIVPSHPEESMLICIMVSEAFCSLIEDEKASYDHLEASLLEEPGDVTPVEVDWDDMQIDMVHCLLTIRRVIVKSRRRLMRLRDALPTEI